MPPPAPLRELAGLFLRLGATAFGGPAAHVAMMHAEVVRRRGWLSDQEFLDLIGAASLVPGPNSTEMAIHLGYRRAGWPGLAVAGAAFILPAALIVLGLAWAYKRYGTTPGARAVFYGVGPVVVAVVLQALVTLLPRAVARSPLLALVALGVFLASLGGVDELALLAFGGLLVALVRGRAGRHRFLALPPIALAGGSPVELGPLFASFLKFGSVIFGSGYVLIAFLRGDLVERLGWITERQLVDAVAVGQVTPGPVFTTATFVGYLVAGLPGAAVATLGIFLPSFAVAAALGPLLRWIRRTDVAGDALDGVTVAALGLMAAVTVNLGLRVVADVPTAALFVAAAIALVRFRMNASWAVAAGAAAGLGIHAAT